jgi:phage terminase large subunit
MLSNRPTEQRVPYKPYDACRAVFHDRSAEILIEGPAGTGKSRAVLEKIHLAGLKYPGARFLMVRKTRISLNTSGRVTFEDKVKIPAVVWEPSKSQYMFPTGAILAIGGMDKTSRILSTEYDIIYVQEATELDQTDWETLLTRLRNYVLPYQQIIGDCNPSAETHWLLKRHNMGYLERLYSKHTDNPLLYNHAAKMWTQEGLDYISKLSKLTGHTKARLLEGKWASATGVVYPEYMPADHLIDPIEIPPGWQRYMAIDFGFVHPFICQWWAISPDDTMYRYKEIYFTERTVREHSKKIIEVCQEIEPAEVIPLAICDHDAEDRATLRENHIRTKPANKSVMLGIENTKFRLAENKVKFFRGALVETDPRLEDAGLPTCTEEEFGGYIWDTRLERPVKLKDHGMDATRYMVQQLDGHSARRKVRSMRK